ncbi:hypothetical protein P2318_22695 [Myxococcaceae bacterium GXIMD 01537]
MPMPVAALVSTATPRRVTADPVREAVARLARALPARTDSAVLLELLEDDLREGLDALGDVEAHFTDVLEALQGAGRSPRALVDAADDARVLQRLDYLVLVVTQLRRRLSRAAGMMRHG